AFGHDIFDSLFSKTAKAESRFSLHRLNRVTHFSLALAYVFGHSMILFYQVMALNVAINSFNNTLFSLLLSNQFI
ncbi:eukaryotic membrane protein family-domain-containing protein, partial [Chytriomyces sp. MP71]